MHARVHWNLPQLARICRVTAHGAHTVATIKKLSSSLGRVQVRRKGRYIGEIFRLHKDAGTWALEVERRTGTGVRSTRRMIPRKTAA